MQRYYYVAEHYTNMHIGMVYMHHECKNVSNGYDEK